MSHHSDNDACTTLTTHNGHRQRRQRRQTKNKQSKQPHNKPTSVPTTTTIATTPTNCTYLYCHVPLFPTTHGKRNEGIRLRSCRLGIPLPTFLAPISNCVPCKWLSTPNNSQMDPFGFRTPKQKTHSKKTTQKYNTVSRQLFFFVYCLLYCPTQHCPPTVCHNCGVPSMSCPANKVEMPKGRRPPLLVAFCWISAMDPVDRGGGIVSSVSIVRNETTNEKKKNSKETNNPQPVHLRAIHSTVGASSTVKRWLWQRRRALLTKT